MEGTRERRQGGIKQNKDTLNPSGWCSTRGEENPGRGFRDVWAWWMLNKGNCWLL